MHYHTIPINNVNGLQIVGRMFGGVGNSATYLLSSSKHSENRGRGLGPARPQAGISAPTVGAGMLVLI